MSTESRPTIQIENHDSKLHQLENIFPNWETNCLLSILEHYENDLNKTIATIIDMEEDEKKKEKDDTTARVAERRADNTEIKTQTNSRWNENNTQNRLLDDFLRIPSGAENLMIKNESKSQRLEYGNGNNRNNTMAVAVDNSENSNNEDQKEEEPRIRKKRSAEVSVTKEAMYCLEKPNSKTIMTKDRTGSVIKSSPLDLEGAKDRIKHRGIDALLHYLHQSSSLYQKGVINDVELATLRDMVFSRLHQNKNGFKNKNVPEMTEFEWYCMILRSKGISPGLRIRISGFKVSSSAIESKYIEYCIRVIDIQTGKSWFVYHRFREFYGLYKRVCRLSFLVQKFTFPTRRNAAASPIDTARYRLPALERFLCLIASLVSPAPIDFLRNCALKELQKFLHVESHLGAVDNYLKQDLQHLSLSRIIHLYAFQLLRNETVPEGKACKKFLEKIDEIGIYDGVLEEMGQFFDSVRAFIIENHSQTMLSFTRNRNDASLGGKVKDSDRERVESNGPDSCGAEWTLNLRLPSTDEIIADSIRYEIEERLYLPVRQRLEDYVSKQLEEQEMLLITKIGEQRGQPQISFGIALDKISLCSWEPAIKNLSKIDSKLLPIEKLDCLVRTANLIHLLHRKQQKQYSKYKFSGKEEKLQTMPEVGRGEYSIKNIEKEMQLTSTDLDFNTNAPTLTRSSTEPNKSEKMEVLSGDDFFPICIYVLAHSAISHPLTTQYILFRLCDSERRMGETGYYLASFEASISHLLS